MIENRKNQVTVTRPKILYSPKIMRDLRTYVADHYGKRSKDDGVTIRNALNFKTDGERQEFIRSAAIFHFGCPVVEEEVTIKRT